MENEKTLVWAEYSVMGHLRSASITALLDDEELKEFKSISKKEQEQYLEEYGEFTVDDYRVEWREIEDIHIEEK